MVPETSSHEQQRLQPEMVAGTNLHEQQRLSRSHRTVGALLSRLPVRSASHKLLLRWQHWRPATGCQFRKQAEALDLGLLHQLPDPHPPQWVAGEMLATMTTKPMMAMLAMVK